MVAGFACSKCGYRGSDNAAYCIKCGERLVAGASSATQLTMSPHRPGSSSVRAISHVPVSVDGHEIISVLGRGGMGSVYLAYEPLLDREVALKVLSSGSDNDEHARAASRFLSEAVLTGRLGHGGIIPIHRIGHDPNAGYYYTMRYINGNTLAAIIDSLAAGNEAAREEYTLTRLLSIFHRICQAVGFAHQNGILHRDIKPANVMIAEFGEVFVLDWGLAKDISSANANTAPDQSTSQRLAECRKRRGSTTQLFLLKGSSTPASGKSSVLKRLQAMKTDSTHAAKTQVDQVLGTPGYLSPEQGLGNAEITAASDVYSLGVTLYEMLTLRRPVEAPTPEEVVIKTINGDIVPVRRQPSAARLPSVLCDIVTRALAREPAVRFPHALSMAQEIGLYLEGRSAFKSISKAVFGRQTAAAEWKLTAGEGRAGEDALVLNEGGRLKCERIASGDFQFECEAYSESARRWSLEILVNEPLSDKTLAPRYVVRLGNNGRSFIELLREGSIVQRRLDTRLQAGQIHKIRLDFEDAKLRVWIDGRKYIEYAEIFPHAGGGIEIMASVGAVNVSRASLVSRGAPLQLSFMALPDALYRRKKFAEARELYRRLSESHPDREEGILALFKAGMCSTAMQDLESAFAEFTRLEGTMYDHYCAIGLAQIGMIDGNIEWAWEALKNASRKNKDYSAGLEIWFTLIDLIQHLPTSEYDEKRRRYIELITELEPAPEEAARLVCELLEFIEQSKGDAGIRAEATWLLETFSSHLPIRREALYAIWRVGIDPASLKPIGDAADSMLLSRLDHDAGRIHLLRAEVLMAIERYEDAFRALRDAILESGPASPEGLWAKSWQILLRLLKGQFQNAITECHEMAARYRKRCAPSTLAYVSLLESIAHAGKGSSSKASSALIESARSMCVWGTVGRHILSTATPERLEKDCRQFAATQVAEALWLAGEFHLHSGRRDLASLHFTHCCKSPACRAFTSSLAQRSLAALQGVAK